MDLATDFLASDNGAWACARPGAAYAKTDMSNATFPGLSSLSTLWSAKDNHRGRAGGSDVQPHKSPHF